jgi:hypothetical protein
VDGKSFRQKSRFDIKRTTRRNLVLRDEQDISMKLFAIRRRSAFADVPDLEKAAARSAKVGNDDMPNHVRWIRSYVVEEPDGRLGTVCIYQAVDTASIREHARRAEIAVDEIAPVLNTVIVRQDPA